eukprot:COSAG02_NODE_20945_length_808_cov_61.461213_1_plen_57_part_00
MQARGRWRCPNVSWQLVRPLEEEQQHQQQQEEQEQEQEEQQQQQQGGPALRSIRTS